MLRQVAQDRIVLHLAKGHEIDRPIAARRQDSAGEMCQFPAIAQAIPGAGPRRQKIVVGSQRIVREVEEVLHVVGHQPILLGLRLQGEYGHQT